MIERLGSQLKEVHRTKTSMQNAKLKLRKKKLRVPLHLIKELNEVGLNNGLAKMGQGEC